MSTITSVSESWGREWLPKLQMYTSLGSGRLSLESVFCQFVDCLWSSLVLEYLLGHCYKALTYNKLIPKHVISLFHTHDLFF